MTTYTCDEMRPIKLGAYNPKTDLMPVESVRDAAKIFAGRIARKTYGKRGFCHHVRADNWTQDGRIHNFEAFIGVPWERTGCTGRNIWLTVYVQGDD